MRATLVDGLVPWPNVPFRTPTLMEPGTVSIPRAGLDDQGNAVTIREVHRPNRQEGGYWPPEYFLAVDGDELVPEPKDQWSTFRSRGGGRFVTLIR